MNRLTKRMTVGDGNVLVWYIGRDNTECRPTYGWALKERGHTIDDGLNLTLEPHADSDIDEAMHGFLGALGEAAVAYEHGLIAGERFNAPAMAWAYRNSAALEMAQLDASLSHEL